MVDVFDEVDQAMQREKLAALWSEYRNAIMAAIILTVVGTGINVWWQQHRTNVLEAQTAQLLEVLLPVKEADVTDEQKIAGLKNLQQNGKSQLDVLAGLQLASLYEGKGQHKEALETLRPLTTRRYTEKVLQDLAIVQYVRLSLAEKGGDDESAKLLAMLNGLTENKRPFRYSAMELQGLLLMQQGKVTKAQSIFTKLGEDIQAPQSLRARAQAYAITARPSAANSK